MSSRFVQKYFFECSNNLHNEIVGLNDFALPMCTALWNFRQTVAGEITKSQNIKAEELSKKYNTAPGARGTPNLLTAFRDMTWSDHLHNISELYLIGIISIYEYWCEEITDILGRSDLAIKLQFPTNPTATNGVRHAINELTKSQSTAICSTIYPSIINSKKYSLASLDNLLLCFRYFKELRNSLLHRGKLCDGKLWGAQSAFAPVANNTSLGMDFTPRHSIVKIGDPVQLDLHGVLGFTEVILRIVTTLDSELSRSKSAETHLLQRLKAAPNLPLTPPMKVKNILNNMGIQNINITPEFYRLLKDNSITV